MNSLLPFLHRTASHEHLSAEDARAAMLVILDGQATVAQIAAFLTSLRMKTVTATELTGFARAMRERSRRVEVPTKGDPLLDTCGTGGDGGATFNISTIAAFVAAGAGVRVAKHGNRSMTSECGSADILEALGVHISHEPDLIAASIAHAGIGFLFAPALHPAMKHAQPARLELKMRTVFNLLGPLTNPAGAPRQLIGAPSAEAAELMAHALAALETEHAFVVHGSDGLDEVTTTGSTLVFEVRSGAVLRTIWQPDDFGIRRASLEALRGGNRDRNCAIAHAILNGEPGPPRDIVLLNAAAALIAAGRTATPREAVALAADSIDSGAARDRLARLVAFTRSAVAGN
jgi:anthranilate phosphoribosyltransferase